MMITIDTGDTVFHRPSRETWLVAYVEDGRLCPCGWPLSMASLSDCLLVEKATAAGRDGLLAQLAASKLDDPRVHRARARVCPQGVMTETIEWISCAAFAINSLGNATQP